MRKNNRGVFLQIGMTNIVSKIVADHITIYKIQMRREVPRGLER